MPATCSSRRAFSFVTSSSTFLSAAAITLSTSAAERKVDGEVAKLKARLDEQVAGIAKQLQEQQSKNATPVEAKDGEAE